MAQVNAAELRRMVEYITERLEEAAEEGGLSAGACSEIGESFRKRIGR